MTSSHLAPPTGEVGEWGAATGSSAYSAETLMDDIRAEVSRDQVTIDSHTKKQNKKKTQNQKHLQPTGKKNFSLFKPSVPSRPG